MLLDRNPLDDIAATRAIHAVVQRGQLHDRAALDAMLARARAQVAVWDKAARRSRSPRCRSLVVHSEG